MNYFEKAKFVTGLHPPSLYRESACGGRYIGVVSGLVGVVALVEWGTGTLGGAWWLGG